MTDKNTQKLGYKIFKAYKAQVCTDGWKCTWGMPTLCVMDSGPGFRNTCVEEASKIGVKVQHSSAFNPSSQSAVEWGVGSLKHLLKRFGSLTQLQIHEVVF